MVGKAWVLVFYSESAFPVLCGMEGRDGCKAGTIRAELPKARSGVPHFASSMWLPM